MKKTLVIGCLLGLCGASVALAHDGAGPGRHFARLDTDGDGKVSLAEMKKMTEERFAKLDTNKDGFLVAEEMHGGWRGHGHCDGEHGKEPGKQGAQGTAGTGAKH
jgi:hypothetical protein